MVEMQMSESKLTPWEVPWHWESFSISIKWTIVTGHTIKWVKIFGPVPALKELSPKVRLFWKEHQKCGRQWDRQEQSKDDGPGTEGHEGEKPRVPTSGENKDLAPSV